MNMHYYKHHIGDYRRDTAHLSLVEHGVYRQLLDWYYLDEMPIPSGTEWVCRRLRAKTDTEQAAVDNVLRDFFERTDLGWSHKRCDEEIYEYQGVAQTNRINGKLGGRPKKTHSVSERLANDNRSESENNPNHKPLTINHSSDVTPTATPTAIPKKGNRLSDNWKPDDVLLTWAKNKRPDLNLSDTVESFCNYWQSKSGKDACKLDWAKTFKNWVISQKANPFAKPEVRPSFTKIEKTAEQIEQEKAEAKKAHADYMRQFGVSV